MIVRVSPGKAAGVFHDLMFKCASENRYPGHRERGISRHIGSVSGRRSDIHGIREINK